MQPFRRVHLSQTIPLCREGLNWATDNVGSKVQVPVPFAVQYYTQCIARRQCKRRPAQTTEVNVSPPSGTMQCLISVLVHLEDKAAVDDRIIPSIRDHPSVSREQLRFCSVSMLPLHHHHQTIFISGCLIICIKGTKRHHPAGPSGSSNTQRSLLSASNAKHHASSCRSTASPETQFQGSCCVRLHRRLDSEPSMCCFPRMPFCSLFRGQTLTQPELVEGLVTKGHRVQNRLPLRARSRRGYGQDDPLRTTSGKASKENKDSQSFRHFRQLGR